MVLNGDPQRRPSRIVTQGDDLVHHHLGLGGGDGEAQALNGLPVGHHLHVGDAHHLSGGVDEGPSRVARVEGGGGLEQGHALSVHIYGPVDGGDDAVGHGAPQLLPQGIPDGVGRIAHL